MKIITLNEPNLQDFSQARNRLLAREKTGWVMFLDSDEKISPKLQLEINQALKDKRYNYAFKRQDRFMGKILKYGETAHVRLTRLIQPGTGRWRGKVHERFISRLPLKTLKAPLLHQRSINLEVFINRLNFYSSLRSQEFFRFSLFKLLFFPIFKFLYNYFFRFGFLDGISGLVMAFMMSLHSLFVRVKTYEKIHTS